MAKIDPETAELLRAVDDDEWRRLFNALVMIARRECGKLRWKTGKDGHHLPSGQSVETIAQEAIARLFNGQRAWNRDTYPGPSPMAVLISIVESMIGDLIRSPEHKRMTIVKTSDGNGDAPCTEDEIERMGNGARKANPLHVPDAPDKTMYFRGIFARIRATLSDRPDLLGYLDCQEKGLTRKQVATELGVPVERVDEIRKQFLSRTKEIYAELFGEETQKRNKEARIPRS